MANDTCAAATVISALPYSLTGINTTGNADDPWGNPPCASVDGISHKAAWWTYTNAGTVPQLVHIETNAGASNYHDISVWSGSCGSLTNMACTNLTYSGKGVRTDVVVPAAGTIYILVTDDDFYTGITSVDLSVTGAAVPVVNGFFVQTSGAFANGLLSIFDAADGTFVGAANPVSISNPGATGITRRPSDGHIFILKDNNLHELTPNLAFITTHTLEATPVGENWGVVAICFDAASTPYVSWVGSNTVLGHHRFKKLHPTTFATVQTWTDFLVGVAPGLLDSGGVIAPDGTKAYWMAHTWDNTIYELNLSSGIATAFGTYGTYPAGVNPTGDGIFFPYAIAPLSNGNVLVDFYHATTGNIDDAHAVLFDSSGSILTTIHTPILAFGPIGTVLLDEDETSFWTSMAGSGRFTKYTIAGATIYTGPDYTSDDYSLFYSARIPGVSGPPPPTTPPSVLVNSNACCGTSPGGPPSAGPVLPPVNTDWIPSCPGGGLVPTVPDLTLAELWDY